MKSRICFVGVQNLAILAHELGVAVRDMEEMRQAIRELTTNREKWMATGVRRVAFMRREFNEDRIHAPYLDTFHQLTDQGVRA
jgi:hypothetical protein